MTAHTAEMENIAPEDIDWIDGYPTPPTPPIRPFHAISSVYKLIRNKEDTRQVFEVVQSLSGSSGKQMFRRFVNTAYGKKVIEQPVKLEEVLSDREVLRTLPEGSVGRIYLDFMEGENLTPDGLIDAAEEAGIDFRGETQFEAYRRLYLHLDVSHDLWHVLSGYGRDALGELCNLIFTHAHSRNPGFVFIVLIGMLAQKLEQPTAPVIKALNEARRNSYKSEWLPAFDVEELLTLPLAEARRRLNITDPVFYNSVPDDIKNSLLQPKVKETQAQREGVREVQPAA